jgi:hypothetical protein
MEQSSLYQSGAQRLVDCRLTELATEQRGLEASKKALAASCRN